MPDLLFQNFSTVQSKLQPGPNTLVAASTITPSSLITWLTGTTAVANVTPPVTGQHMLVLIFATSTTALATTGNIATATAVAAGVPVLLFYNPVTGKYYGK